MTGAHRPRPATVILAAFSGGPMARFHSADLPGQPRRPRSETAAELVPLLRDGHRGGLALPVEQAQIAQFRPQTVDLVRQRPGLDLAGSLIHLKELGIPELL